MLKTLKRNAQSAIEYSVLLMLVIAVFLGMQQYIKRGLQGRWKDAVDDIGVQYHPIKTTGEIVHRVWTNSRTEITTERVDNEINTYRWDTSNVKDQRNVDLDIRHY